MAQTGLPFRSGEDRAWDTLDALPRQDVCARAAVEFDGPAGCYIVRSFGQDILVAPAARSLSSPTAAGTALLAKLGIPARLSVLWYLISARDVPLSGELKPPVVLSGGQIYVQGAHVLPLGKLARKYGPDPAGFVARGRELGGGPLGFGDASVRLHPLPRVPAVLILWKGDEEFPARCELLFDATCGLQLPADIVWAAAAMTVAVML